MQQTLVAFALLACWLHHIVASKPPISIAESAMGKSFVKPAIGAAAVVGLAIGKRFINGPTFNEIISLHGKNIVITGGNTGLGKATATKLASLGANTILLCKTAARGEAAVAEIKQTTGSDKVSTIQVDLSDLSSIQRGVADLKQRVNSIDILVNNAGVMAIPQRTTTKDGFEMHMGINHLGHFALTGQLLDLLRNGDDMKRIVNVASHAHLFGDIDKNNLMLDKPGSYEPWPAYGNSKQANILFTKELARRLQTVSSASTPIVALCCHPGLCRTELGRYMFDMDSFKIPDYLNPLAAVVGSPICKLPPLPHSALPT
jgi:NAD(P)-dependent dehydrogenase (short-subunit alcohol dehydrogenase family)